MLRQFDLDRRKFLDAAGRAALVLGLPVPANLVDMRRANAQTAPEEVDHTIRIAPVSHEIAPRQVIKTTAYNGSVPGPALRLQEGKSLRIKVVNESGYPSLIHWHGLYVSSEQDGAAEQGSPIIDPGGTLIYAFTPRPAGTRWYHSHARAMTEPTKSTYSGEIGFLIVESAAGDPGRHDREALLASRTWEGRRASTRAFWGLRQTQGETLGDPSRSVTGQGVTYTSSLGRSWSQNYRRALLWRARSKHRSENVRGQPCRCWGPRGCRSQ